MSLPDPIHRVLRRPLDDVAVQRIWRRVQRTPRGGRERSVRPAMMVGAALAIATAIALFLFSSPRGHSEGISFEGHDLVSLEMPAGGAPRLFALSDGSTIELSPGALLETLENRSTAFAALLKMGRAHFEVKPNGPRRWTIECGILSVEVVGTGFTIVRTAREIRVDVTHGIVLVRGERVPDRVARLTDGMSIVVTVAEEGKDPHPTNAPLQPPEAPSGVSQGSTAPVPSRPTAERELPAGGSDKPSWRKLAERGEYKGAYEELGATGIREKASAASVDELLALADVARLSGHPADAVLPLQRAASAADGRASLAAFTLGRLELDRLGSAEAAAAAFQQAIRLGLPGGLLEDALARLVEAEARAGHREGAEAAFHKYEQTFPESPRLPGVRKWVAPE